MSGLAPVASIDPVAPSPSLLTVARARTGEVLSEQPDGVGDPFWWSGIAWSSYVCSHSHHEALCQVAEDYEREPPTDGGRSQPSTHPFTYYTPLSCEWTTDNDKLADEAAKLTEARAAWALARALWAGEGLDSTDPTLQNSAQVPFGAAASDDLDDVFGKLQTAYMEATDGLGGAVLHVPLSMIPHAGEAALIFRDGDRYRTWGGADVSPGPGYPEGASESGASGHGPDVPTPGTFLGNAAGDTWVFLSGPIEYALGNVRRVPEDEAMRRGLYRQNRLEVWAEREAIVRFDPCTVFAALVESPAGVVS